MTKKNTFKQPGQLSPEPLESQHFSLSFGDPEPVENSSLLNALGTVPDISGEYYVPPVDRIGLSSMKAANGQHGSCMVFRRNMAANAYVGGALPADDFRRAIFDVLTFGECYLQKGFNLIGEVVSLKHLPALNMRVKTDGKGFRRLYPESFSGDAYIDFPTREIFHIKEYDTVQEIYGVPDWLGGLQSALLNCDATLFRRRYFKNGAHLGYILYTNDTKLNPKVEKALQEKIQHGKGVGNFKTAYFHIPGGGEKAFQIIPIGDISQKDEFLNIKNISANDVREAHRVPPILMGVAPTGTGSLGDAEKIYQVYVKTEVKAITQLFSNINAELQKSYQLKFSFPEDSK